MAGWRDFQWRPYVSVAERRSRAAREAAKLRKKGHKVDPVRIEGRTIATTFWGKAWCENLERYSDFENRLPRGRTYVRNGSVMDLQIAEGRVDALVSGSELYKVKIGFAAARKAHWEGVKKACAGRIDSVVELLQGRLSEGVMGVLTAKESGLFPAPDEIDLDCSCPDWADMCKHVAAVLYGVGARLDARPELLFLLRGVDPAELVSEAVQAATLGGDAPGSPALEEEEISRVFGIELDTDGGAAPLQPAAPAAARAAARRAALSGGKAPSRRQVPARAEAGQAARPEARAPAGREAAPRAGARQAARPDVQPDAGRAASGQIEDRLAALKKHFLQEDTLANAQYRRLFSVPAEAATRELKQLCSRRYLIRRGAKRGTHYLAGVELY
ncbi:MAG: SWIM zinc finger family protein [Planctomycetes bacterium]|nr:SWIM zinc finger family protein [Planctomycetota bacterium]